MEINCIHVTVIVDSMLTASWLSICSNAIPVAAGLRMKHNGTVFSVIFILMLTITYTFVYTNFTTAKPGTVPLQCRVFFHLSISVPRTLLRLASISACVCCTTIFLLFMPFLSNCFSMIRALFAYESATSRCKEIHSKQKVSFTCLMIYF